jgi:hypothetical protein
LQDEYNPIDLLSHAPRSDQASQAHPTPFSDDGEVGEAEVLHMVAECFNKYDNVNFDGCETKTTIHDRVLDALVEDPNEEDNLPMNDNGSSNEEREEITTLWKQKGLLSTSRTPPT